MPADPVVSPADTIRRAFDGLRHFGAFDYADAGDAALDALLAVVERDKAEIADLRSVLAIVLPWISTKSDRGRAAYAVAWGAAPEYVRRGQRSPDAVFSHPSQEERDRQQIARLTEAATAAMSELRAPRGFEVGYDHAATRAYAIFAAVLAGEEDAGNG